MPAMAAGVVTRPWEIADIVALVEAAGADRHAGARITPGRVRPGALPGPPPRQAPVPA
jgi:hypothetical protein